MHQDVNVILRKLTDRERLFCEEYVVDLDKRRAYLHANPGLTSETYVYRAACLLLKKDSVQEYIRYLQDNISLATGVTAIRNVLELKKIGYGSLKDIKSSWKDLADWDSVPDAAKDALQEVKLTITNNLIEEKTDVVVKMFPKVPAIQEMNKMLGFYAPDKLKLEGSVDSNVSLKGLSDGDLQTLLLMARKTVQYGSSD